MKKKILAISLVVALLAIAIVGGSLAWFTAEDEVTNTFTVGSIEIQQNEKDENGNDFVQDQVMLPIVKIDDPKSDDNYISKVVTVTNIGKNDAYLRTHIAVPAALVDYLHLATRDQVQGNRWNYVYRSTATVDGVEYAVFTYMYEISVAKDETTDILLEGVYMDARVDIKLNEASGKQEFCMPNGDGTYTFSGFAVEDSTKINVLVVTQAVQADGFENAQSALDSAFGTGTNPLK